MTPKEAHNEAAPRIVRDMVAAVGEAPQHLNVLAESVLLGVAMVNFPNDGRRQALIIQEIANAAMDRAAMLAAGRRP